MKILLLVILIIILIFCFISYSSKEKEIVIEKETNESLDFTKLGFTAEDVELITIELKNGMTYFINYGDNVEPVENASKRLD